MNQLLKLENKNGKQILSYHYKKIQDIDDVILQLLNEADIEGFIRSSLDKAAGNVDYDITGYMSLAEIEADRVPAGVLRAVLSNLYGLLAYLEDSFIDVEYVMFDAECILVDPDTKMLYLIVLPCQDAMDSEIVLADCLNSIVNSFTYDQRTNDEYIDKVRSKIQKGIRSLADLQYIIEMLPDGQGVSEDELLEDWKVQEMPSERQEDSDVQELPDEQIESGEAFEEATVVDLRLDDFLLEENEAVKTDEEVPEESGAGEEQGIERIREELRREVMAEVHKELRADVMEEVREELREEVRAEVREELRAEVTEEVRRELRAQMMAEASSEPAPDVQGGGVPYLIRRKTGEVIQLNKHTFIIGKLKTCCDYTISNNNAISRLHAVIKYREASDDYFIVDCNSTNHIYLDGRQIPAEQPVTLKNGMHIHLALEEFVFQIRG